MIVFILFGREAPFSDLIGFKVVPWMVPIFSFTFSHRSFFGFKPFRIGFGFCSHKMHFGFMFFASSHSDCFGSRPKNLTPIAVCSCLNFFAFTYLVFAFWICFCFLHQTFAPSLCLFSFGSIPFMEENDLLQNRFCLLFSAYNICNLLRCFVFSVDRLLIVFGTRRKFYLYIGITLSCL